MANKKIKKIFRYLGLKKYYQLKRPLGTDTRWNLIESNLSAHDKSLLDIGCNIGKFTSLAAKRGIFSVGADVQLPAVMSALKGYSGQANLSFGNWSFTPENIERIPHFDVILCLSVHHYWHREYGEAECWDMVRHLAHSSNKLFFEPSVRLKKYGTAPPEGFVEGNSAHLEDRIREEITEPLCKKVAFLGETEAPGEERFRPLFLIT